MSFRMVTAAVVLLAAGLNGCTPAQRFERNIRHELGRAVQELPVPIIPGSEFKKDEVPVSFGASGASERPESSSLSAAAADHAVDPEAYGGGGVEACSVFYCVDDAGVEADCAALSLPELKEDCFTICENGRVQGKIPATTSCSAECNVSLEELRAKCKAFVEYSANEEGFPMCSRVLPCE